MMTQEELRKKYPLTLHAETYYEIYDDVDAKIVAFFFDEKQAREYLDWKNNK